MFLGCLDGWKPHCFLNGLDTGGDWLGLPPVQVCESGSRRSRGSPGNRMAQTLAAYRVYRTDGLLAKAREIEDGGAVVWLRHYLNDGRPKL